MNDPVQEGGLRRRISQRLCDTYPGRIVSRALAAKPSNLTRQVRT
jgi:hypothetical protein